MDTARNMLKCMQLKPQIRQQLTLLLQRQHLEEQELRLRHWMELEKFHKGLGKIDDQTRHRSNSTSRLKGRLAICDKETKFLIQKMCHRGV